MSTPEQPDHIPEQHPGYSEKQVEVDHEEIEELIRNIHCGYGDLPEHVQDIITRIGYAPDTELEAELRAYIGHYIERPGESF